MNGDPRTTAERQSDEIIALQGIYGDAFLDSPPPRAWKGAARLPEFILKVAHLNPRYAMSVFFHLKVQFPKTYPTKAAAIFAIVPPVSGISSPQISALSSAISAAVSQHSNSEMVYDIVELCSEWMLENINFKDDIPNTSLASEMESRTLDQQRASQEMEEANARRKEKRALQEEAEYAFQLEQDNRRKAEMQRQEKQKVRARRRAYSDATEKPSMENAIETFDNEIDAYGIRFNSVKVYHGRSECLGMMYTVEPMCEADESNSAQMDLHVILFESNYYTSTHGRKQLRSLERELQKLTKVDNKHLLRVFAAQLTMPKSDEPSRLAVLLEKKPAMTMQDLLLNCDCLREEKVSEYLAQILRGLHDIHSNELVHRAISVNTIGLADQDDPTKGKMVKIMKVTYGTKVLDLHKSESFGPKSVMMPTDMVRSLPDGWLPREALESSLSYTRSRDIHAVGVIFMQMVMGLDVTEQHENWRLALQASTSPPALLDVASAMLLQTKKPAANCINLLEQLSKASLTLTIRPRNLVVDKSRTPMGRSFDDTSSGYFRPTVGKLRASRWREDFEDLERLGAGGFGKVYKARNKLDGRIYAVKSINLRTDPNDHKIFREVNALSRLTHRFIVRYYTTWLEESDTPFDDSTDTDDGGSESTDSSGRPGTTRSRTRSSGLDELNPFAVDMDDLTLGSYGRKSFSNIHFGDGDEDEDSGDEDFDGLPEPESVHPRKVATPVPQIYRALYIQMEFVGRQTLHDLTEEGISEEEAWRLFQQIVDALVHMSTLGILHRDIKGTNIFIDDNGDCKVGDFGLATSSLASVDPSDVSHKGLLTSPDMTKDIGTNFYIAPEILSHRRGHHDQSKADMYSLGILFFEMNYRMNTRSERVAVCGKLRQPDIIFPDDWDTTRVNQKTVIRWLLQHEPVDRPTAVQLSRSSLLPPRLEDEYFQEAVQMMTKPDSAHYQTVISSLFEQSAPPARGFLYDSDLPESSSLKGRVIDELLRLFKLHGARHVEVPLLMPKLKADAREHRQVQLLDKYGELLSLPVNAFVPFARLAARSGTTRIKRYHIGDVYRDSAVPGHPRYTAAAIFDIITPDLLDGPRVAMAELLALTFDCLNSYPNLAQSYVINVSHPSILGITLDKVPVELHLAVLEILVEPKITSVMRRSLLTKKGISKAVIDDIEILIDSYEDCSVVAFRLAKSSSTLAGPIKPCLDAIKQAIDLATQAGVNRNFVSIQPMPLKKSNFFSNGVCFEVVNRARKADILAAGGRYDQLISRFFTPVSKPEPFCAFAVQIHLERITSKMVEFQKASLSRIKEERSFGYWSVRRCDVYVASFQLGYLSERVEIVSLLWNHGISADLMYESGVQEGDLEAVAEQCSREGIMYIVFPRPRNSHRELLDFKVKSVLQGSEYELKRQELVPFLQGRIAEQNKRDLGSSGVSNSSDATSNMVATRDSAYSMNVHLVLPLDAKKQRKQTKQIYVERAYDRATLIKSLVQSSSIPTIAVDVTPNIFEVMVQSSRWLYDDEAWRALANLFPTQHMGYANQIHDAVLARKSEGSKYILLFTVREERTGLVSLA